MNKCRHASDYNKHGRGKIIKQKTPTNNKGIRDHPTKSFNGTNSFTKAYFVKDNNRKKKCKKSAES
jgi:hypothetical protein